MSGYLSFPNDLKDRSTHIVGLYTKLQMFLQ